MKKTYKILIKWLLTIGVVISVFFYLNVGGYAYSEAESGDTEPTGGDEVAENGDAGVEGGYFSPEMGENPQPEVGNTEDSQTETDQDATISGFEANLFEKIYSSAVENSDKIFSVLAFLGTLVVGWGYKSGLLPLLRDALSKLKGAIDDAREESGKNELSAKERMKEIGSAIVSIDEHIKQNGEELSRIEWQFESYEDMLKERNALRAILSAQVDMLYSIFMSSSLPQYQKDEIGEKIQKMREELKRYEITEN